MITIKNTGNLYMCIFAIFSFSTFILYFSNIYISMCRHTVVSLLVFCRKGIDELKNHVGLLNKSKGDATKMSEYASQAQDNKLQIEIMEGVAESLDTAKDSIELMNIQEPVRVLGIESQFSLALSLLSGVVSFLLYVALMVIESM